MKFLFVALLFTVCLCKLTPAALFDSFAARHAKRYNSPAERQHRFNIFKNNLAMAERLNALNDGATYGVTRFFDLTRAEFEAKYLMVNSHLSNTTSSAHSRGRYQMLSAPQARKAPAAWDWREHGVVSPVRAQLECGSCWAHAAAGNMESVWAVAGHGLNVFSVQQLVDCVEECNGCKGGYSYYGYEHVIKNGGIELEKDYPYENRNTTCRFDRNRVAATFSSTKQVHPTDAALVETMYENGPVAMAVYANFKWQFYTGGVFKASVCNEKLLNHEILAVGYGTNSADGDYWIVKNSWGADWGEDGFIRLARGNNCHSMVCTTIIA